MWKAAEPLISTRETILVVDDSEPSTRQLRGALDTEDRRIDHARSVREALSLLPDHLPDLIVLSLDLPDLRGVAALDLLRDRAAGVPILAIASNPTVDLAVRAVRAGALDLLGRPVNTSTLAAAADRALTEARGSRELARAREASQDRRGLANLLTQSPRMLRVFDQIRAVAATDATALILGETGTGKELVSRAIHERSRRRDRPFIGVNCGAFTESLLESELFGHERGSFTGAMGKRQGVFELANGGTLFLDELGETTLNVQVNLLRVLEEMRFRRVGGQEFVRVDVRIVAATNAPLEEAVRKGRFREDLFYRLNVFPIHLPPLRERPEDIPLLTRHFLEDAAAEYNLPAPTLSPAVLDAIMGYRWPGNVRQLRGLCERWVIVANGREVTADQLPPGMAEPAQQADAPHTVAIDDRVPMKVAVERTIAAIERAYLQRLLKRTRGHLQRTAEAAGITRRTLYTKMKAYGLDAQDFRGR